MRHSTLLPSFLDGWNALPTTLQTDWLQPRPIRSLQRHTTMYLMWTTWPEFAYRQLKSIHPRLDRSEVATELARWISHQLKHSASGFGLPRVSDEAVALEEAYNFNATALTRGRVARLYVDIILDKAMIEVEEWMKQKIEKDGLFSLYPIVDGQPVLHSMMEFMVAGEGGVAREAGSSNDCKQGSGV